MVSCLVPRVHLKAQASYPAWAFLVALGMLICLAPIAQVQAEAEFDQGSEEESDLEDSPPDMLDAQAFLFERIQRLENALWALTGTVEELQYKLEELSQQQFNSYRDLDRRILEMGTPGAAGESPGEAPLPEGDSEEDLYRRAFGLLKQENYAESLAVFLELNEKHPNGIYVAESWYWQGELHLRSEPADLEQARQIFGQLIIWYPTDRRVPEAMFKLGLVYQQLGDEEKALEYLRRVVDEHPASAAAAKARNYLEGLE